MNRIVKTCIASVVSEIQQSDIYLTVKARLFETPGANLNGVRVTAAFLDEIVANSDKYVGLPLCADVKSLANGDYQHLGHLYDARTGEFHSVQIGSFYQYEKEETADGAALIGYARIMKRNKAVCRALSELFADGALKFSFEISCGTYRKLEDGTLEIDADASNYLEGAAVVSFPACENAVALDLVAECNELAENREDGENNMTDIQENTVVAEAEKAEEAIAEEQTAEVIEEALAAEEPKSEQTAEEAEKPAETASEAVAETIIHETHIDSVEVCDTDTGECVTDVHETHATYSAEEQTAESNEEKEDKEKDDEEESEGKPWEKKETASASDARIEEIKQMVAELKQEIVSLRAKLAQSLEEPQPETIVAEAVTETAQAVNPFVAAMSMEPEKKYSLLESEEPVSKYTLLDRA